MIQPKETMMNKKNPLTIWAKRAIPALALAATAGVMLPGCDKDPIEQKPIYRAPYEKELLFDNNNADSVQMPIVKHFAYDTACKHVYLTVKEPNSFKSRYATYWRNDLSELVALSDKISGRGDFRFYDGSINPADSLWFVQHGWTVNQHQH